jgi:hypothetical protein
MRQGNGMEKLWFFKSAGKVYSAQTRNQLKKKRKALRSNPTFKGYISDIIPISLDPEQGEARMPIIYIAAIKKSDKNASA